MVGDPIVFDLSRPLGKRIRLGPEFRFSVDVTSRTVLVVGDIEVEIIYGPLVVTAFLTLTDIYEVSYRSIVEPGAK